MRQGCQVRLRYANLTYVAVTTTTNTKALHFSSCYWYENSPLLSSLRTRGSSAFLFFIRQPPHSPLSGGWPSPLPPEKGAGIQRPHFHPLGCRRQVCMRDSCGSRNPASFSFAFVAAASYAVLKKRHEMARLRKTGRKKPSGYTAPVPRLFQFSRSHSWELRGVCSGMSWRRV